MASRFTEKVKELDIWKYKVRLYKDFRIDVLENVLVLYGKAVNKLGEYEDAEEQGALLRLPCKVGDKYYEITTLFYDDMRKCGGCEHFHLGDFFDPICCDYADYSEGHKENKNCLLTKQKTFSSVLEIVSKMEEIGKTVFLDKQEAKRILKEMRKQDE